MNRSIEAAVDFTQIRSDELLSHLLRLPTDLRPTHFNIDEGKPRIPLESADKLPKKLTGQRLGFFLYGPGFIYDISYGAGGAGTLFCDFDLAQEHVEELLIRMAALKPSYGYAASPEERLARNRVYHHFGINKLEAWVGRESAKWLPGIYWLNLLSEELAVRHGVSIAKLASASSRYWDLGNGLHLFRLYDRPPDWSRSDIYPRLLKAIPGLFDVEVVKQRLPAAKNFLEVQEVLSKW